MESDMRRLTLLTVFVLIMPALALALSCEHRSPVAPTSSAVLDQFLQALRQQGLSVSLAGQIPPQVNGFFSVPAHEIRVNAAPVNAFEYPNTEAAAAEAALISQDGQPSPNTRITWVSTPRFYRQGPLIVVYVGCSAEIVQALQATVGAPIAIGRTPCEIAR
jgi:hypothetical protein